MTNGYENLANAIVLQAVKDWRASVKKLRRRSKNIEAGRLKSGCERFFLSAWFETLTAVDGSIILCKLKKEEGIHDE